MNWNKKYSTIAIYSFIVIASSILFYLIMSGLGDFQKALRGYTSVMYPFLYGFILAYLINFLLNFFKKLFMKMRLIKKIRSKVLHSISLILAYVTAGLFIYLFLAFVFPQLVESIRGLVLKMPDYIRGTTEYIQALSDDILLPPEVIEFINTRWDELAIYINNISGEVLTLLLAFLGNMARSVWNVFLGIILSIYMLVEKERFISISKKMIYGIFSVKAAAKILELSRRTRKIFSNFLGGKILDSFIIGVLTFVILSLANMPYSLLIAFIIAITNIIPFFGPFIGAIPSVIIIFFESPTKALWFLLIILIIQQIDGNIIGPKILGDSLGISSFWILFAILVSSKFFGFSGMIIGVPLFVLIYSVIKEFIEMRLQAKNMPLPTEEYLEK